MNPVIFIFLIVIIVGSLGYMYISNSNDSNSVEAKELIDNEINKVKNLIQPYVESVSEAGDIIRINKSPTQIIQQKTFYDDNGDELTEDEVIQQLNSTGTLTDDDVTIITGESSNVLHDKYGIDTKYDNIELDEDYYQIGQFFTLSGILKKVVPDSCRVEGEEYICDYIEPSNFKYQIDITCEYRDYCNLGTLTRVNQETTNTGSWEQKYIPNIKANWAVGEYLVTINANSEVINDDTQRPYEIHLEHYINIIDGSITS